MKSKQHLTIDQSLKAFSALGYPLENIISSVEFGEFVGAEISDEETLSKAIDNANSEIGKLILFKVNAETRSFAEVSKNNHYVALYFSKSDEDGVDLIYIDPTGEEISHEIKELITSFFPEQTCNISSSTTSLQYTDPIKEGGVYQMRGNDYDCGVLVALAASMIRTNYKEKDSVALDEDSSKEVGQKLRKLANKEITSEAFWQFFEASLIESIPANGSPTKLSGVSLDDDLDLDQSEDSDSSYSESESEEAEEKLKNSLEESFDKSFGKLSISKVKLGAAAVKFLRTHDDDSSDEEDTKERLKKYRSTEEAWERFSSPRVYYSGQEYTLVKQTDGNYIVQIPQLGSPCQQDVSLSQHSSVVMGNPAQVVSYIYFGPRNYNKPNHQHLTDQRVHPFIAENYDKLRASFELHHKGIEALYEDRISEKYYAKKSTQLSSSEQLEKVKAEVGSSINKALNTLILSVNWQGGAKTGLNHLYDVTLENSGIKKSFENLMAEVLQKRVFSTRISEDSQLETLRPFSEKIYDQTFGQNQVYSMLGSAARIAIEELRVIGAVVNRGGKPCPPNQIERGKSYEELVNSKKLPKTKLGKFAWSIVKELDTTTDVSAALESKKEHLLNDLIEDLSRLTQGEIDAKFHSLRQQISQLNREQTITTLNNLIVHNLANIPLRRKTFSDNVELVQESFSDIMVNIRLSNRSQSRRVKKLQQEEGDKVWSKTVTWAHAFEQEAQSHALEKETITSKAGRNSLILDFGKYEEGKRKGNTVTEGIDKLKQDLKIDDKIIAHSIIQIMQGTPANQVRNLENEMFYPSETHCSILTNIAGLLILEFKRNPNFTSFMTLDLIKSGKITWKDALDQQGKDGGMFPMSITDAMKSARCLHDLYGPYMPHPYQIQGAEKFEVTEAKVLELITREHEIHTRWNLLHKELLEEREKLEDAIVAVSDTKTKIKKIEKQIEKNDVEEKEDLKIDIESAQDDLDCFRSNRTAAKKAVQLLGFTTIQDQLQSESPNSQVQLAKTSKLSAKAASKSKS